MRIDVLTLFPEMFAGVFTASILGKAREKGAVTLNTMNFRDFSGNKHGTVDDAPYGGGGGMVLKPEPIFAAVEHVLERAAASRRDVSDAEGAPVVQSTAVVQSKAESRRTAEVPSMSEAQRAWNAEGMANVANTSTPRIILMCPQGERFTQAKAEQLAQERHLIFICGHYEGYDERIRRHLATDELSVGDFVLTGGEIPAMAVIDSVVRLLPGVLGNEQSAVSDSFSTGLLEHPHYTRPPKFRDWEVPDVLLSGHHENIEEWRRKQSLLRTWSRRPDLLQGRSLDKREQQWIREFESQHPQHEA